MEFQPLHPAKSSPFHLQNHTSHHLLILYENVQEGEYINVKNKNNSKYENIPRVH